MKPTNRSSELTVSTCISTFVLTWSLSHGVPAKQSAILAILITGQSSLGAVIWEKLCIGRRPHPIESFAAGFVLISTVFTVIDQLLVPWTGRSIYLSTIYCAISVLFLFLWIIQSKRVRNPKENSYIYVLPVAFCVTILAQNTSHGWLVAAIGFALTALVLFLSPTDSFGSLKIYLIVIATALLNSLIFFGRPSFELAEWRLFGLFTGSDDQIYSEAATNSLGLLGPFDSIFSLHTHVPYHWFTFAWTASFSHLIEADAFTATLHIAAPIGFLYTALLTWAVVYVITESNMASVVGLVATFMTSSFPTPLRFVELVNTSNVVSHLWLLLTLLLLVRWFDNRIRYGLPLLLASSAISLLSKVPYGFILYCGIGGAVFASVLLKKLSAIRGVVALGLLIASAGLISTLFLKPQPWQDRGFDFPVNSANFGVGSRFYPLVPTVLVAAIGLSRIPYYLLAVWGSVRGKMPLLVFLLTSSTASLIRFLIEGASAEKYFLSAGILFSGVGIGVFWGLIGSNSSITEISSAITSALISCVVTLLTSTWFLPSNQSAPHLLLPVALGGIGIAFALMIHRPNSFKRSLFISSITASAVFLGCGVGSFVHEFNREPQIEPASMVSESEIESLTWIRLHTGVKDLLASNRNLCGELVGCKYDETRQVIAAFSNRQVLIEGPRFLNSARNYPAWALERIFDSLEFASNPTKENLTNLRTYGVDWFYLDKSDPRAAPINTFGGLPVRIAFENANTAVIDLRNN